MKSKKMNQSYINESTEIEYTKVGDYYVPNLVLEQKRK